METIQETWGLDLMPMVCEQCDWNFLLSESEGKLCPHCFEGQLQPFELNGDNMASIAAPELMIPFAVNANQVAAVIQGFKQGIPFAPDDLKPETIMQRVKRIYIPMWLVDAAITGTWQASVGFKYQVESYRSNFQGGQWSSQKVYEDRLDWEERMGNLQRAYDNVSAPALEEHQKLMSRLGAYPKTAPKAYQSAGLTKAFVRLPNRAPDDAFPDAQANFKKRAADEVRKANNAEGIRDFQWEAQYSQVHWTQLLLPTYMSYYHDDEGKKRIISLNGFDGHLAGEARGSMKRARQVMFIGVALALIVLAIAIVIGFSQPDLEDAVVIAALVAAGIGGASFLPMLQVWRFNEQQERQREW